MKAKKLLAVLGVLAVALPGMALAYTPVSSTVVEGHSAFQNVLSDTPIGLAAIAGKAAKTTTFGGVAWFGTQSLYGGSQREDLAAGAFVIATETGDESPSAHMDASYAESYQVTDPNGRHWTVDRYEYPVCIVGDGDTVHEVPCVSPTPSDAPQELQRAPGDEPANQKFDLDGDGEADDLTGDGTTSADRVTVIMKSLYVAEVGATAADACTSQGDYNFLLVLRTDMLNGAVPSPLGPTGQVDLWFSEERPQEPASRTFLVQDNTGVPCAP